MMYAWMMNLETDNFHYQLYWKVANIVILKFVLAYDIMPDEKVLSREVNSFYPDINAKQAMCMPCFIIWKVCSKIK